MPIVPLVSQGQHNLGRGKGQYFYHVSEEVKGRRLHGRAGNSRKDPGTSEETIPEGQAGFKRRKPLDEDNRKAVFGKTERTV